MHQQRPVNLNLMTLKFPPAAIASILHRISGVILFLLIPAILYILDQSLRSEKSFTSLHQCLTSPLGKFGIWVLLSSMIYHIIAGIRHLLMDAGIGEGAKVVQCTAKASIALSVILILLLGVWLW